jgi:anti-anti-sigma factor
MQTDTELLGRVPAWLLCQEGGPIVSFELSSRVCPGFAVVALAGELDAASAHAAAAAIQAGVGPGQRVIVDLEALRYAGCHALGALAVAAKRARRAGCGVLLAAPQAAVLRVLELTGLAGVFCVYASVAAAAGAVGCGSLPCAARWPAAPACPGRTAWLGAGAPDDDRGRRRRLTAGRRYGAPGLSWS